MTSDMLVSVTVPSGREMAKRRTLSFGHSAGNPIPSAPTDSREFRRSIYAPFIIRSKEAHRDYWLIHLSQHSRARDMMVGLHWLVSRHAGLAQDMKSDRLAECRRKSGDIPLMPENP